MRHSSSPGPRLLSHLFVDDCVQLLPHKLAPHRLLARVLHKHKAQGINMAVGQGRGSQHAWVHNHKVLRPSLQGRSVRRRQ